MKENRERLFESPILIESFLQKYGKQFNDGDLLFEDSLDEQVKAHMKKYGKTSNIWQRRALLKADPGKVGASGTLKRVAGSVPKADEAAAKEAAAKANSVTGKFSAGADKAKGFFSKQAQRFKNLTPRQKAIAGIGAGVAALGTGIYAANKYGGRRPAAETVVAFTKYGVLRFAEAQKAKGLSKDVIVENIVENLRVGMRKYCNECDNPSKCKAKLAAEIAKVKTKKK